MKKIVNVGFGLGGNHIVLIDPDTSSDIKRFEINPNMTETVTTYMTDNNLEPSTAAMVAFPFLNEYFKGDK